MSRLSTELTEDTAYEQAIRQLYQRINYEKIGHAPYSDANYRLDRTRKLLSCLGDPHLAAPVVHIAGTKGKGSTATFLSELLAAAGYRTGLYTSPHIVKLEERFRVNGQPCTADGLVALADQTLVAAKRVEADGGGRATFFELTTALAFLHFAQQKAQVAVIEVGLGGRLDSTNVCQPTACVITSIGLDHQAQLGYTIAEIAGEKAGIIKSGIPVISSARHPDARRVIADVAASRNAPLRLIAEDFDCTWTPLEPTASTANAVACCHFVPRYIPSLLGTSVWDLSLLGAHQADNLGAALATMDLLAEQGWNIPLAPLPPAVSRTQVPARLQIVDRQPWRLVDTAHNPDSIAATLSALDTHFADAPLTIIFAASRDKDVEAMLQTLHSRCGRLILTQYHNNPRGMPLEELTEIAQRVFSRSDSKQSVQWSTAPTPAAAWQLAVESAAPTDVVCATGSFFLAAELLA